jgi:hypothetical protein
LCYDENLDLLPHQRYDYALVAGLLPTIRRFAGEVWQEIR